MESCIDPDLARYTKQENTQHQWKFQKVDADEHYPFGVKVMYRGLSQDEAVKIVKSTVPHDTDTGRLIGLKAIVVKYAWLPTANVDRPEGMYILRSLPSGPLRPQVTLQLNLKVQNNFCFKNQMLYVTRQY